MKMKNPNQQQGYYEKVDKTIIDNFKISSSRLDPNNDGKSTVRSKINSSSLLSHELNRSKVQDQGSYSQKLSNKHKQDQLSRTSTKNLKQQIIHKKYLNNDYPNGFIINGINFFSNQIDVNQEAEVIQDCYSVKGDYFYLKKGQIVMIRSRIQEFAEIKYQRFVGYFPGNLFKLIIQ